MQSAGSYTVGGFRATIFPQIGVVIRAPDALVNSARGRRANIQAIREAIAVALVDHHNFIMREHFRQTNRQKYDHKERTPKYKRYKRRKFNSITDLKASGDSMRKMLAAAPRVSYRDEIKGVQTGFMRYRWPFPKPGKQNPRFVTIQDMNREVSAWTGEEVARATEKFRRAFVKAWEREMKSSPRWKKEIKSNMGTI